MEPQKAFPSFRLPAIDWQGKSAVGVVLLGALIIVSEWAWRTIAGTISSFSRTLQPALHLSACVAVISLCSVILYLNISLAEALKTLSDKDVELKGKELKNLGLDKELRELRAFSREQSNIVRSLKADLAQQEVGIAERDSQIRRLEDSNQHLKTIDVHNQEEIAQLKERLTEYHRRLTADTVIPLALYQRDHGIHATFDKDALDRLPGSVPMHMG
ncbi:hypothetical protein NMY22_g15598 [Coprinellus aureogranulatus]|nr:hypothetical protein NMY22_g15598 [Coprinellus aureogranulatus]